MEGRVLAKRYGRAVFELALESGGGGRVAQDMERLRQVAEGIPAFLKGLSDWRVDVKRRGVAAKRIAVSLGLGPETAGLLRLLVARERIDLLPLVAAAVAARARRFQNLLDARLLIADREAIEDIRQRIEGILSQALSTRAQCRVEVDPDLLGGFALQIGDVRYDASLKGKLERMKEELDGHPH